MELTKKNIEVYIHRFMEGETTNAEEQAIYRFFRSGDVPEHLKEYAPMFAWYEEGMPEEKKMEDRLLPADIDYTECNQIRLEARQKLQKIRPLTLGQAARISGVSPSDVAALMVWLSRREVK